MPTEIQPETDELTEARANVEAAQAQIDELHRKAQENEPVTSAMLREANDELDLMKLILKGAEARSVQNREAERLERISEISIDLAALATDRTVEKAEAKMLDALRGYMGAVHAFDLRQAETNRAISDPALAPLPDSISLDGARIHFEGAEIRRARFQTTISKAAKAAISELYPRAVVSLDTPND